MSSLPDAVQILQAMSCSEKLSKVVTAVKEALDDGVCPQKVDDAVESRKRRLLLPPSLEVPSSHHPLD